LQAINLLFVASGFQADDPRLLAVYRHQFFSVIRLFRSMIRLTDSFSSWAGGDGAASVDSPGDA